MTEDKKEHFLFIDLETSGLDPKKDSILEIAIIITDFNLRELDRFHSYVSNPEITNDFVKSMHEKSGLAQALNKETNFPTLKSLQDHLLLLLDTNATYYYAGSSVHFDAAFMAVKFPKFADKISHRHLDITSLKFALRIKNPKFKDKSEKVFPAHRAEADIQSDLNFARKYFGKKRRWNK